MKWRGALKRSNAYSWAPVLLQTHNEGYGLPFDRNVTASIRLPSGSRMKAA
jgi:hypothetical protein